VARPKVSGAIRVLAALALAAGLALAASACGGGGSGGGSSDSTALAVRLGNDPITEGEVQRRALFLGSQFGTAPDLKSAQFAVLRRQAAENLIDERIYHRLAIACGKPCRVTDAQVENAVANVRTAQFGGSQSQLGAALAQRGITMADLTAILRGQFEQQKLANRIRGPIRFTDAQAQRFYATHLAQYRVKAQRRASHILLPTKAAAERVRAQATPANFAQLARKYSIDTGSKANGGDIGTIPGDFVPEVNNALASLPPGTVSRPVRSQFGWHLLLVRQSPARQRSFAEVRKTIVNSQTLVKQNAAVSRWQSTVVAKRRKQARYVDTALAPPKPATRTTPARTKTTPATRTPPATKTTAPANPYAPATP
jgi:foldase protein PrsA